jgi:hypothetical protein
MVPWNPTTLPLLTKKKSHHITANENKNHMCELLA